MKAFDPLNLAFALALLALVPILVVVTTSFVKIAVVLSLVRNALGVQQIPPNMALYGLAAILSFYIMAPVGQHMYETLQAQSASIESTGDFARVVVDGAEPLRGFLLKHSRPQLREFFLQTAHRLWDQKLVADLSHQHFIVLMPAFLVSELTSAFEIGFLLYLPFIVIDLIVSNILLAMGMMMVSPVTISLPLKLFLFVMVDGWSRLIRGLVLTYV
ncbi:type III secretion system export apparatus subunit SctR [Pseudothauera rhizosphaerae]|uniref:EscR/YscR/HrcR family type III secretion system export apparatus protein n=1 Tax=Pseudothauera rhizosphaerae TaxID=2565932 RepID=A0A4S4ADT2_9RHOO|nr:type III secretion system export apparatus subunit SctR [Pseudothauera rhizosphaerae]THF57264.1 EscR/YscR/HrcR family type III secretion system export apparatus protein [Pseudothauera rhizosphaerae]